VPCLIDLLQKSTFALCCLVIVFIDLHKVCLICLLIKDRVGKVHSLVIFDPLSFWQNLDGHDVSVEGSVLILQGLDQQLLLQALDVECGLIERESRHI